MVAHRGLLMERSIGALFGFIKKLGSKPIETVKMIYEAKSISVATYGAAVWGIVNTSILQRIEDSFLKRLVGVPQSCSSYNCHSELDVPYISDKISSAPNLLWHSIWKRESLKLTQEIVQDWLTLDGISKLN